MERPHVIGNIRVTGAILYRASEASWPDYVFDPDYKLMRMDELEEFIAKEKHLPNIPSSDEIKDKQMNLIEFQMKLLEKIEQLTLYTVQQEKIIDPKPDSDFGVSKMIASLCFQCLKL